ncbi:MAG: GTP-binding protein [Victivallaceae bacterium]|nr:GTP-binding protein [Victivallaceae bacterium]
MGSTTDNFNFSNIRNIGVIAHIDAGKTTITERFLYYSGKTHRIGDIDSGSTVMDYLDEERKRGITIVAAAASFNWDKYLIHLIDTPGHIDFTAEVERSIRVSDGAVVVFSGVEGVEAQSEKVWRQSVHYNVPKIAFINKLDRLGASFERCFSEIKTKFPDVIPIAFHYPVGIESEFSAVVDLMEMKLLKFEGDDGTEVVELPIPDALTDECEFAREELLSSVADLSEVVADYYLAEKTIPLEFLKNEIRKYVVCGVICPVFAGSAKKNIGIQPIMDAIIDYLPSPEDREAFLGHNPKSGDEINGSLHDSAFAGLIFKVVASGSADLLYLRTYSGTLALNDSLINPRTKEQVKIKRLLRLYSRNIESIEKVGAGDIIGVIGPKNSFTGDTLCSHNHQIMLEEITFPEPVISMAVEPRSIKDKDKLHNCLEMLCREDPTLNMQRHETTGQLILSGMGELHLEINRNRIKNEFSIEARYGKPRVAFRETLETSCSITGIFNKTLGDTELYTEVDIQLEIVSSDDGIKVDSTLGKRQDLPLNWKNSATDTLMAGLKTGGNLGYSLIHISGTVTDIRGVPDKTTEGSIAGAVMDAISQAIRRGTKLLEPLMKLDITAPEEVIGEITGYLQIRRAIIHHIGNNPDGKTLSCEVPLAEMFGFSSALPKLSGGRASFSMEPHGYQEISLAELQKLGNDNILLH